MAHLVYIDEHVFGGLEAIRDAEDVDDWDLTFVATEERVRNTVFAFNTK
jgi:hypothetical protein